MLVKALVERYFLLKNLETTVLKRYILFKNGTCYSEEDCKNRGGESKGSCAEGYGVCCVCKFFHQK